MTRYELAGEDDMLLEKCEWLERATSGVRCVDEGADGGRADRRVKDPLS